MRKFTLDISSIFSQYFFFFFVYENFTLRGWPICVFVSIRTTASEFPEWPRHFSFHGGHEYVSNQIHMVYIYFEANVSHIKSITQEAPHKKKLIRMMMRAKRELILKIKSEFREMVHFFFILAQLGYEMEGLSSKYYTPPPYSAWSLRYC